MRTINTYPLPEGQKEAHDFYGDPTSADWGQNNLADVTLPFPLRLRGKSISTLRMHVKTHDRLSAVLQKLWNRTQSRLIRQDGSLSGQALYDATIARLTQRGLIRITEPEGYAATLHVAFAFEALAIPDDVTSIFESEGWVRHANGQFQRVSAV